MKKTRPNPKAEQKLKEEDKILSEKKFDTIDKRIKRDEGKLQKFFRRIMNK
jgi:hypothetical protein